jgi:predicted nucleotidyltransferase
MVLGIVQPQDDVDGRTIYTIHTKSTHIEYAYKAEVLRYLETGVFVYDETIDDPVDTSIFNK